MSNETPGRDPVPGWGQPNPAPEPEEATAPWPAEATPPDAPWPAAEPPAPADEPPPPAAPWATTPDPAPAQPEPPAAAPGTWGTPPVEQPAAPAWGTPAPQQPAPQPAAPAWGAPAPQQPAPQPAAPAWGAPAPQQPAPQPAAPAWGTPAPQQPAPQPAAPAWGTPPPQGPPQQLPPAPGTWGAPPPQAPGWGGPAGQQPPGGWGAPPQQGGWAPGAPGTPGGPPVGWSPAPAQSSNGCLKGCLIVGAIGVVLAIIAVIALVFFAGKLTEGILNSDGSLKSCSLVSDERLSEALGTNVQALPLAGIWDATMGNVLDKRVLKDAEDCWIAVGSNVSTSATADAATGRLAASSGGDASGVFRQEKEKANRDGYLAGDVSGLGDEAFCTSVSAVGSAGVLARAGDRLVYVSLIAGDITGGPETCAAAQEVAKLLLR